MDEEEPPPLRSKHYRPRARSHPRPERPPRGFQGYRPGTTLEREIADRLLRANPLPPVRRTRAVVPTILEVPPAPVSPAVSLSMTALQTDPQTLPEQAPEPLALSPEPARFTFDAERERQTRVANRRAQLTTAIPPPRSIRVHVIDGEEFDVVWDGS